METKKKKTQKIDEEAEARINNSYADFMERALEKQENPYRDQSKRLIDAQKKKKANKK